VESLANFVSRVVENSRVLLSRKTQTDGRVSTPVWLGLRFQKRDERFSVTPHQEKLECGDHYSHRNQTLGVHQNVKRPNVKDHRGKNRESNRHETTDQQQQPTEQLHGTDDVHVTTGREDFGIIPGQSRRGRRHGNKIQKEVRAEDGEHQSKQETGDDGKNFHEWFRLLEGLLQQALVNSSPQAATDDRGYNL